MWAHVKDSVRLIPWVTYREVLLTSGHFPHYRQFGTQLSPCALIRLPVAIEVGNVATAT